MATGIPFGWTVQNAAGTAVSGAKIFFYVPGTTTLRSPYTDSALTVPSANPVVADSAGWFLVYLSSELGYDIVVKSGDESITYQERTEASNISGAQPVDPTLTAIAALGLENRKFIRGTGVDTGELVTISQSTNVFNVLDYGATGDGTTDDSAALQAAMDAASAAGVPLYAPGLTYICKNLRPASNLTVQGVPGKTVFRLPANAGVSDYIVFNANPGAYTDSNITFRDVIFDGNNVNEDIAQISLTGPFNLSRVTGVSLERCSFINTVYIGAALAGCKRVTLRDPVARNCGFRGDTATVTLTIASPCVVTLVGHGFPPNQGVRFSTTGALPTGITATTNYYVKEVLTADTFTITATGGFVPLGAAVDTSGTQSGVQSVTTKSSNGGPAIWVANQGSDQSEDVLIENILSEDNFWAGLHVNALRAKVIGGFIKNVQEAGVFAPNVIGGDVLCDDLLIDGLTVDGVTQSDISGAALELGATNVKVVNGTFINTDQSGIALLDVDGAIIENNTIGNFNKDSKSFNPQGPGVLVLSVVPGNAPRNIQISGNRIYDDQGVVTGHAGISVVGTDPCDNITIGPNQIADVAWESGEDVILTGFGTGCTYYNPANNGNIVTFTASGTYTPPAGLVAVIVEVVGGGGAGGGGEGVSSQVAAGAGGGAGGYSRKHILAADLGATETVTVGAAGAAGTAGNNAGGSGGTSSFGSHLSATGGTGGGTTSTAAAAGVAGTAAGVGSGGDINYQGAPGGGAMGTFASGLIMGGQGGASYFGGGGRQRLSFGTTVFTGFAGGAVGAGGSGGTSINAGGAVAGGAGGGGIVIVQEIF